MTRFLAGLLPILSLASPAWAGAIYPIDRASVLAGSRFDFKVEFDQVVPQDQIKVTVGGKPAEAAFGRPARFLEREDGKAVTSWVVQGASLTRPGPVEVVATGGGQTLRVNWEVYATGPRKARNVILFIGDGLSPAHRTAARFLAPLERRLAQRRLDLAPASRRNVEESQEHPFGHPKDERRPGMQPRRPLDLHTPGDTVNRTEWTRLDLEDLLETRKTLHEHPLAFGRLAHQGSLRYASIHPCRPNVTSRRPSRSSSPRSSRRRPIP